MNLQTLLEIPTAPDFEVLGIAEHTAEVQPGYVFLGVAANDSDLNAHCRSAVSQGAVAIICDSQANAPDLGDVPVLTVADLASKRSALAAKFYGDPSAHMTCIGITGTNGKTSVAYHIADLSQHLGEVCGYCGTLGWGTLDALQDDGMTTSNAIALQRQLAVFHEQAAVAVAMEISSHALDQDRAAHVQFDVAVFTNLTRDHLDYHGTEAAYAAAKRKLFTDFDLRTAVINVDDVFGRTLVDTCSAPVVTYGANPDADWCWQTTPNDVGLAVSWQTPYGQFEASLPVLADYAVGNITAALATLVAVGHDVGEVFEAVSGLSGVPGRMELIRTSASTPTVIVDYAHTPDALSKVLTALRPYCSGQLICIIGCGGDRDRGKRPLMGRAAIELADMVWLTSDNPRSEDPQQIIVAMMAGISKQNYARVRQNADRRVAIHDGIQQAAGADVILIAGKGHEDYQEIMGKRFAFDDRVEARRALQAFGGDI
jgi:UDP-N-acetylmuramoyl-L-alanyl-D-glutamate--2,6-diaminopimelate ligase